MINTITQTMVRRDDWCYYENLKEALFWLNRNIPRNSIRWHTCMMEGKEGRGEWAVETKFLFQYVSTLKLNTWKNKDRQYFHTAGFHHRFFIFVVFLPKMFKTSRVVLQFIQMLKFCVIILRHSRVQFNQCRLKWYMKSSSQVNIKH